METVIYFEDDGIVEHVKTVSGAIPLSVGDTVYIEGEKYEDVVVWKIGYDISCDELVIHTCDESRI